MLACSSSAPFHLLFIFFLKLILTVFGKKQCKHALFTFSKILHCMFYCLISLQFKHFKRVKMSGKALRSHYVHVILAASQLHRFTRSISTKPPSYMGYCLIEIITFSALQWSARWIHWTQSNPSLSWTQWSSKQKGIILLTMPFEDDIDVNAY